MPYRAAWIAAQKPMFRLESYNSGISASDDCKDPSQTIVDQIYSGQAQADEGKAPPRPPNAWILYRTAKLTEFKAQCPSGNIEWKDIPSTSSAGPNRDGLTPPLIRSRNTCLQAQLSRLISSMWKTEEAEVKAEYYAMAEERKRAHSAMFPHYKYRPKKKKTARQADREGEAAPIALSATTSSSYLLSPSQVSPPILVTHSAKTRTEKKKLNKTKSLHSIRSKIVSPRAAAPHRHRSASPFPTPLLSPTVDALGHSYDSSPHSLVNGLSPVTPFAEADMMQRRTLVRRSHGDTMLATYVPANPANMQTQTQPLERQQRHSIQLQQQQQEQQLYESSGVNFDYLQQHKPSFDAATESGEEAQPSPTLVITPPAAPPSVFARDNLHPAATMATPHDGIIPWTGLYQADDGNAPQQQQQQQHWTHTTSSPPSVGPPYFAAPDGVILHPFYQPMCNATSTDYFQDVDSRSMQASLLLEQHKLHNNSISNSSIHHSTTRHSLDGAASPNSLRFTSSIMSRPVTTDASFAPAPASASQAVPIIYGGGPAGPPLFSATRHAVVVPTTSSLGYTSHAPLYGSNNNINITNVPPFSPGFATNALQLQFADLQMQHQQSHSPLAHPSLVPRS